MPYHHGDLRRALIDAAANLLEERSADAFSLREVARRAGVSPAAPAHHFGDSAGLLTAVVAEAFEALAAALRAGDARGGADGRRRLVEQGVEYVGFALRHPARFRLMFGSTRVREDAALGAAGQAAFAVLEDGVRALRGLPAGAPVADDAWAALLATWSIVHGFAHLAIAGRFDGMAQATGLPDRSAYVERWLRRGLEQALSGLAAGAAPEKAAKATSSTAASRRQ